MDFSQRARLIEHYRNEIKADKRRPLDVDADLADSRAIGGYRARSDLQRTADRNASVFRRKPKAYARIQKVQKYRSPSLTFERDTHPYESRPNGQSGSYYRR